MYTRSLRLALALAAVAATACTESAADPDSVEGASTPLPAGVDIAENMARFAFDAEPVFDDGLPAYGNAFITQGYLYPEGYLDGNIGVLADGAPADPDAVIGTWTCRGYFVGDGAHTTVGPMVITTQLFDFYDEPGYDPAKSPGSRSLITEGYEVLDPTVQVPRAITGGTGAHTAARGTQATQTFLGLNITEGVNLRMELEAGARTQALAGDASCAPAEPMAPIAQCSDL